MDDVPTEDLLLATLWRDTERGEGSGLARFLEQVAGNGRQLSTHLEVAVAVESLVDQGLVGRVVEDGSDRFRLTEAGRARAKTVARNLTEQPIDVVDGGDRRNVTVGEAAQARGRSPVSVAAECSADGVYYDQPRVEGEDVIDREDERDRLATVVENAERTGAGGAVRVVGPDGSGKTTLVTAVLEATSDAVETVHVPGREGGSEPYQPVRDVIDAVDTGDPFEAFAFEPGDAEELEAQQTGLFTEITKLLVPAEGVRVLSFDDVDHADPATWSYLAYLCERLVDYPLVLVLTHGPGTLTDECPIGPESGPELPRVEVGGLDRESTARLVEQVVGRRGVPAEFVDAVYERTGGIPLYVEATVEALVETNKLDPQFQWYPSDPGEFDLPDAVTETLERQVGSLRPDVREVLRWVATAQGFTPVSLVADLAGTTPERVATVLETVGRSDLVERTTRDGETHVSFSNDLFGEAVLDGLSDDERRRRHEQVAAWLTEHSSTDAETGEPVGRAATVASHYEQAGDTAAAIEWYERAADRARDVYAHETAIQHLYSVIDLSRGADDTEALLSANEELVRLYLLTGEYEEARRHLRFVHERVDPDDAEWRQRVAALTGRFHLVQAEYDDAIEVVRDALDHGDDREEPTEWRGRLQHVLVVANMELGDYETARQAADRYREVASGLEDPEMTANALRHLSRIAYNGGDTDRAREYATESLEVTRSHGDRNGEAMSLKRLGALARNRGDYDRARECYDRALEIREEIGHVSAEAATLEDLGGLATNQGDYDRARDYHERAREIYRALGDRRGESTTLLNLGVTAFKRRAYDEARDSLERALSIKREIGQVKGRANALNNLGTAAVYQGDYDEAERYLEDGIEAFREIDNPRGEAMCLKNLGDVALLRGEYDRARERHEESLELQQATDHRRGVAMGYHDLGTVARVTGEYDRARERYEESLATAREVGLPSRALESLNDLGTLARERGDPDRAREHYEDALDLASDLGDPRGAALSHRGLAALARRRGEYESAAASLEAATEALERAPNESDSGRVTLERARLALARGDVETARERAGEARETFASLGEPLRTGRARRVLGRVAAESGDHDEARDHWVAALETFEEIGAPADAVRTLEHLVAASEAVGAEETARAWRERARSVLADAPDAVAEAHGRWLEAESHGERIEADDAVERPGTDDAVERPGTDDAVERPGTDDADESDG